MTTIYRGDNTRAFGNDFLRIYLNNPNNLKISKAVVQINNDIEKIYDEPTFPLRVNFTGEETEQLRQQNIVKMAVWDENGRRRTAEGKFTFLVKENRINEQDAPISDDDFDYAVPEHSITFDLSDTEFACQFSINATPTALSELINDVNYLQPDNIQQGENIRLEYTDEGNIIINADADIVVDYNDLDNVPKINGIELRGDMSLNDIGLNERIDWTALDGPSAIANKPNFADVAFTGMYIDLVGLPTIPQFVTDLLDYSDYATLTDLTNYVKRDKLMEMVEESPLVLDIYTELNKKSNKLDIDNELSKKVDYEELDTELSNMATRSFVRNSISDSISDLVTTVELSDAMSTKPNRSEIGKANLNLTINDQNYTFSADQHYDVDVNVSIPTKVSQLENDLRFTTQTELGLDHVATKEELLELANTKADIDLVGNGTVTIKVNGEVEDSFMLNQHASKTIDLYVPTKLSQLNNDSGYLTSANIGNIDLRVETLEAITDSHTSYIDNINEQLVNKVDYIPGKTLISRDEVERLGTLHNYDDTALTERISVSEDNIIALQANKVDKVEGKGLSTNDYTDEDKLAVENIRLDLTDVYTGIDQNKTRLDNLVLDVEQLHIDIQDLNSAIQQEELSRVAETTSLQQQIDSLKTNPKVVDVVPEYSDLLSYAIEKLNIGDIILVSHDMNYGNNSVYYIFKDPSFEVKLICDAIFTQEESESRYVRKTTKVNGYELSQDINITAIDVGAVPNDEEHKIHNGTLFFEINGEDLEETFSANESVNKRIRITIPYDTSELTNGANFITGEQLDLVVSSINTLLDSTGERINGLEDEIATHTERLDTLTNVITGKASNLRISYNDLSDVPTKVSDFENDVPYLVQQDLIDAKYVTQYTLEENFVSVDMLPKNLSDLDNDRGYVTNNAIGRGILTFKINGNEWENNTWMANEKYNQVLDIPIETEVSTTSTLPAQASTVYTQLQQLNDSVVHINGVEEIIGDKTFAGDITFTNNVIITKDIPMYDVSDQAITSKWLKDYTDLHLVHKTNEIAEDITGHKTFIDLVTLYEAVGTTLPNNDNSKHLATTEFVKNQRYASSDDMLHKTGHVTEIVDGDKTFTETTNFAGNTVLGSDAFNIVEIEENGETVTQLVQKDDISNIGLPIAPTQPIADNSNFVATTAYVKNQDYATNDVVEEKVHIVELSLDTISEYALKLQARVDVLEDDFTTFRNAYIEVSNVQQALDEVQQMVTDVQASADLMQSAVDSINAAVDAGKEEIRQAAEDASQHINSGGADPATFDVITCGDTVELEVDTVNSLENITQTTTVNLPTVSDNNYHEILLQLKLTSGVVNIYDGTNYHELTEAGIYDVKFIWHHPSNMWVYKIDTYEV